MLSGELFCFYLPHPAAGINDCSVRKKQREKDKVTGGKTRIRGRVQLPEKEHSYGKKVHLREKHSILQHF
jgi:hypothetical protein